MNQKEKGHKNGLLYNINLLLVIYDLRETWVNYSVINPDQLIFEWSL